jgi:hypothetical protein
VSTAAEAVCKIAHRCNAFEGLEREWMIHGVLHCTALDFEFAIVISGCVDFLVGHDHFVGLFHFVGVTLDIYPRRLSAMKAFRMSYRVLSFT